MGRRSLLLIAALIVAALGTTGVFLYVQGVDSRARRGLVLDQVLIANKPIPQGLTAQEVIDGNYLDLREFLHETVRDLPVRTNIADLADQTTQAPIAKGELVLTTQFAPTGDSQPLPVPDPKLAVSVVLDDPGRVAGFVRSGTEVAVLLTTTATDTTPSTTRVLLDKAEVLAQGSTAKNTPVGGQSATKENISASVMTFALSQVDAQRLVFASNFGRLSLALRGKTVQVDPRQSGTTSRDLFN